MKNLIFGLLTISSLLSGNIVNAQSKNEKAVESLVQSYFDALNAGDADKATSMFSKNGVLLAQAAPTATGSEQINGTFKYVFDNFSFTLDVNIEQVIIEGNYAIVSSTSKGSFVIKATNETVVAEYRETFVIQKEGGNWRIVRYMYNQPK